MIFHYYKITNKITNKAYIGITENCQHRWHSHQYMLNQNIHPNYKLQKDWNEYGEENFSFEEIDTLDAETAEIGYNHEKDLISSYNTVNDGYNILIGGQLNPMYTDSVKEKMTKTKQSQTSSIIQLEEISENVFKYIATFNSQKEVQRLTGMSQGNICRAIKNHKKGNGFYWINENELETFEEKWRPSRISCVPIGEEVNGEIVEVFQSAPEADRKNGWRRGRIANAIFSGRLVEGRKFVKIPLELYYSFKPVTLIYNPVSTIPCQEEVD